MPTATASEKDEKKDEKDEKKERKLSESERIDRLEAAIVGRLGINLSEFDPEEIKRARESAIHEAEEKAKAALEESIKKINKPLTTEERMERLERLAATNLGVDLEEE